MILYSLEDLVEETYHTQIVVSNQNVQSWHKKLGHIGVHSLKLFSTKNYVNKFDCEKKINLGVCKDCNL